MYISLNWLKDFINIPKDLDPKNLANELTLKTAEVEGVSNQGEGFDGVVVGEILEIKKHPNADKLNLAKVDIGKKEPLNLIFGSMLVMKIGDKVPVAVAPTTLPTGMRIEKREMRGEPSEGMLCLDQELGLLKEGVSIHYFPKLKPGTSLKDALNLNDVILEFDNKALTHRPDLWGHYGIAREIAAIFGLKLKPYKTSVKFPDKGEKLTIEIKDPIISPRFAACLISNIKIEESPKWLKSRLSAVGMRPVNNIVDVTNYMMLEYGQPMHAYDRKVVKTDSLIAEFAKEGEIVETIDHKKRTLTKHDMIVTNGKEFLDLAGVMGGLNSEISQNTTDIILEAANWNPSLLRQTEVRHGLRSEASQRFEKSLDPKMCPVAIEKAAELILKICPKAKLASPLIDIKGEQKPEVKIALNIPNTISKIGIKISKTEIKKILKSLYFDVAEKDKNTLLVTVPSFRSTKDVTIEDDLIEEIARIYGYENIPVSLPTLPTKLPIENTERFKKHRIREILSLGLGFDEVYNYSFYGKEELNHCMMSEKNHLKLKNFLSTDQTLLRTSLVPHLLKNAEWNVKYFEQFSLYEIGHTYKEIGNYMPLEEKKIGGLILQKGKSENPFYVAKGAVETLLNKFNIPFTKAKEILNAPYAHPSKCLTYLSKNGQTLAQVFMIHPQVIKNHDLEKFSIAMFDANFTEIMKQEHPLKSYKHLPKFPEINIDVSVVVNRTTEIETLQNTILKADSTLIKSVNLFDIYEGDNIDKGKKAVAFTITLQAPDRTLTDEEMTQVQQKIFKNLESTGGIIRGK